MAVEETGGFDAKKIQEFTENHGTMAHDFTLNSADGTTGFSPENHSLLTSADNVACGAADPIDGNGQREAADTF
ncbi:hypothetical protein P3H15_45035 [Rhodococcus sp. T2V]|uniref:hypothetical protein n=1 Tax=Rhodococcus sp. T2V TaxID=3034164 RepID=UPI0023E10E8A|nr:hypothetical protein [Rhodococcus sp. T2V]MDF3312141.1 hypothetical protein [Rhodococcus sp. T2V]